MSQINNATKTKKLADFDAKVKAKYSDLIQALSKPRVYPIRTMRDCHVKYTGKIQLIMTVHKLASNNFMIKKSTLR